MSPHDRAVEAAITEERITVETRLPFTAHWPDDYDEDERVFMRVKTDAAIREQAKKARPTKQDVPLFITLAELREIFGNEETPNAE